MQRNYRVNEVTWSYSILSFLVYSADVFICMTQGRKHETHDEPILLRHVVRHVILKAKKLTFDNITRFLKINNQP
jgi:hypothetical protein